jgi:phosphatidylglycerophosphatase A
LLLVAAIALYFSGVRATEQETRASDDHDPGWIVADEVVGQWIALLPVSVGALVSEAPALALWPGWIAAFLLFRLFDIWKPWIVGRADARGDAVGVMLDDVFAGVFAALGVVALAALAHAWILNSFPAPP